jgi:hypothetical protein
MALTDGLISVWHINNDWRDAFGANHGTAHGATFSTGAKLGSHAGRFDGVDDRVVVPDSPTLGITGSHSVNVWVSFNDLNDGVFACNWTNSGNNNSWAFALGGDGKIYFSKSHSGFHGGEGSPTLVWTPSPALQTNTWEHFVGTYDDSTKTARLFRNGIEVQTFVYANAGVYNSVYETTLGARQLWANSYDTFLFGLLDEVALWNRALSASEVSELYNNGAGIEIGVIPPEPFIPRIVRDVFIPKAIHHSPIPKAVLK